MKGIYSALIACALALSVQAQIDQPSFGTGYGNLSYYSIADGEVTTIDHTEWDIAFSVDGRDLGVFVNEAVASSRTAPLPEVELYVTGSTDFENVDTAGMTRIYNKELSWSAGAFNHVRIVDDPFDFGWGSYDPATHRVNGSRIFVIKLRNGIHQKLEIQSLAGGVYTFRYAGLDGENVVTQTVNKADYAGKTLAYFSLEQEAVLDLEPESWDLKFTRYTTPLDAGGGEIIEYMVAGVLTNAGVEVAKATGIDPLTVDHAAYDTLYSDTISMIGYDWKTFDLNTFQWSVPADLVYFVKTTGDEIWKLQFIDFEGSSTGVTTLEKTFEAEVTSLNGVFKHLQSFEVFPNPATDHVNIAFELRTPVAEATLFLSDRSGRVLHTRRMPIDAGFNVRTLPLDLPAGMYALSIRAGKDVISKPLLIK